MWGSKSFGNYTDKVRMFAHKQKSHSGWMIIVSTQYPSVVGRVQMHLAGLALTKLGSW